QDFTPAGQWGWTDRTVQANQAAAWRNPGGGFGTACNNWDRRFFCTTSPAGENDQMFRLIGNIVVQGTATPTQTATPAGVNTPTPTTTVCVSNYSFAVTSGVIISGTTDTGNHTDDG